MARDAKALQPISEAGSADGFRPISDIRAVLIETH